MLKILYILSKILKFHTWFTVLFVKNFFSLRYSKRLEDNLKKDLQLASATQYLTSYTQVIFISSMFLSVKVQWYLITTMFHCCFHHYTDTYRCDFQMVARLKVTRACTPERQKSHPGLTQISCLTMTLLLYGEARRPQIVTLKLRAENLDLQKHNLVPKLFLTRLVFNSARCQPRRAKCFSPRKALVSINTEFCATLCCHANKHDAVNVVKTNNVVCSLEQTSKKCLSMYRVTCPYFVPHSTRTPHPPSHTHTNILSSFLNLPYPLILFSSKLHLKISYLINNSLHTFIYFIKKQYQTCIVSLGRYCGSFIFSQKYLDNSNTLKFPPNGETVRPKLTSCM